MGWNRIKNHQFSPFLFRIGGFKLSDRLNLLRKQHWKWTNADPETRGPFQKGNCCLPTVYFFQGTFVSFWGSNQWVNLEDHPIHKSLKRTVRPWKLSRNPKGNASFSPGSSQWPKLGGFIRDLFRGLKRDLHLGCQKVTWKLATHWETQGFHHVPPRDCFLSGAQGFHSSVDGFDQSRDVLINEIFFVNKWSHENESWNGRYIYIYIHIYIFYTMEI